MRQRHHAAAIPALDRRELLAGSAAIAALSLSGAQALAQAQDELVLAGGRILTMDERLGELPVGDVRLRGGEIVEVAASIPAPGVRRLDMSGAIVMPGFCDTHWHMWNSIARGLGASRLGPFGKTMAALTKAWTPQASALSVRLACAEAAFAGITTLNNWAHNTAGPEFAEAELEAQQACGLRGRYSYGYPQALKPDQPIDFDALAAFVKRHAGDGGLTRLAFCARGPDRSADAVWRAEWAAARKLGLPITAHVASDRAAAAKGNIALMSRDGMLGADVQIVHATHASAADFALMKAAGSPLSISPWTELEVGYGLPAIGLIAESGVEIGLSVDNQVLAGNADMFSVMKLTADLAAGMAETQGAIPDATVLHWATLGAARSLGLGDVVGSLAPGKRADVIAVRADALNVAPDGSTAFLLTHAARPDNVDFVMVEGVVHKERGRLTRVDIPALVAEAKEAIAAIRRRAEI